VAENNTDPLFYLAVASLGPTFMTFFRIAESLKLIQSKLIQIY